MARPSTTIGGRTRPPISQSMQGPSFMEEQMRRIMAPTSIADWLYIGTRHHPNWHKRWVKLSQCKIKVYSSDSPAARKLKSISLDQAQAIRFASSVKHLTSDVTFSIRTNEEVYFFRVDNEEEATTWRFNLQKAMTSMFMELTSAPSVSSVSRGHSGVTRMPAAPHSSRRGSVDTPVSSDLSRLLAAPGRSPDSTAFASSRPPVPMNRAVARSFVPASQFGHAAESMPHHVGLGFHPASPGMLDSSRHAHSSRRQPEPAAPQYRVRAPTDDQSDSSDSDGSERMFAMSPGGSQGTPSPPRVTSRQTGQAVSPLHTPLEQPALPDALQCLVTPGAVAPPQISGSDSDSDAEGSIASSTSGGEAINMCIQTSRRPVDDNVVTSFHTPAPATSPAPLLPAASSIASGRQPTEPEQQAGPQPDAASLDATSIAAAQPRPVKRYVPPFLRTRTSDHPGTGAPAGPSAGAGAPAVGMAPPALGAQLRLRSVESNPESSMPAMPIPGFQRTASALPTAPPPVRAPSLTSAPPSCSPTPQPRSASFVNPKIQANLKRVASAMAIAHLHCSATSAAVSVQGSRIRLEDVHCLAPSLHNTAQSIAMAISKGQESSALETASCCGDGRRDQRWGLHAVYDGHAGIGAAEFAAPRIPLALATLLQTSEDAHEALRAAFLGVDAAFTAAAACGMCNQPDSEVVVRGGTTPPPHGTAAWAAPFHAVARHLLAPGSVPEAEYSVSAERWTVDIPEAAMQALISPDYLPKPWCAGATATVALMDYYKSAVHVACAGDTRALLVHVHPDEPLVEVAEPEKLNLHVVALTDDHSPELERLRIEEAGGWVSSVQEVRPSKLARLDITDEWVITHAKKATEFVQVSELNGCLGVARSLGDLDFKGLRKHNIDWPAEGKREFSADLVLATPGIQSHTLVPGDEVLLIACDGLWDVLDMGDASRLAWKFLVHATVHPTEARGELADMRIQVDARASEVAVAAAYASARLCELALKLGTSDNITVLIHVLPTSRLDQPRRQLPAGVLAGFGRHRTMQ